MNDIKEEKKSLGSSIDIMIDALTPLDENSRRAAIKAVCEFLGISFVNISAENKKESISAEQKANKYMDIRTLAIEKNPKTAIERAVLVAYYLSDCAPLDEKKDAINKDDIIKYFKQARFPLPNNPNMTLVHTKNAGYLDPAGEGLYKINPVGHNLIVHNLPRLSNQQISNIKGSLIKRKKK
ncbi:MAG: hypothetical protein H5U05_00650 [Candidatus Aminicenantes bacterium]|nr:hypothetical protein [Candidatus Aminicenantes bacterium]